MTRSKVPPFRANFHTAMRRTMARVNIATEEWVWLINQQVLKITPMDTGALRDSNYVVKRATLNGVVIEVGFKTNYAPRVHEWPDDVNWTTPGTGNKYLQKPFYSNASKLPMYIKSKVRI